MHSWNTDFEVNGVDQKSEFSQGFFREGILRISWLENPLADIFKLEIPTKKKKWRQEKVVWTFIADFSSFEGLQNRRQFLRVFLVV